MIPKNPVQEWAAFMKEDAGCKDWQEAIEKMKDNLFEYIEYMNSTGDLPRLSNNEIKELFGYLLHEPMMWEGERERAFLRLGNS